MKKIRRGGKLQTATCGLFGALSSRQTAQPTAAWKPEGEKQTLKSDSVVMVTINFAKKDHKN